MWKKIARVDGNYEVSDTGGIRNGNTGKLLKLSYHTGYASVTVRPYGRLGKSVCIRVHRVVAEEWLDGYFHGAVVNHKDGNKRNNIVCNLEWVTHSENTLHAHKTGLLVNATGVASAHCKLTEEQIESIKSDGRPQRTIAGEFGVSKTTIQNILSGIRHCDK